MLDTPELRAKKIVKRDLEESGILRVVRHELKFLKEMYEKFDKCRSEKFIVAVEEITQGNPYYETKSEDERFYTDLDNYLTRQFQEMKEKIK